MLVSVLLEFLETLERPDVTPPAPRHGTRGRLIRYADRGIRHDLLFALRRRVLRRGPVPRAARVERSF
jgi:hypothetical protein